MKYEFKIIHQNDRFQVDDLFTEWITSSSVFDARETIDKAYPETKGYRCVLIKTDDNYYDR